jgi:hypothetical protein
LIASIKKIKIKFFRRRIRVERFYQLFLAILGRFKSNKNVEKRSSLAVWSRRQVVVLRAVYIGDENSQICRSDAISSLNFERQL